MYALTNMDVDICELLINCTLSYSLANGRVQFFRHADGPKNIPRYSAEVSILKRIQSGQKEERKVESCSIRWGVRGPETGTKTHLVGLSLRLAHLLAILKILYSLNVLTKKFSLNEIYIEFKQSK